MPAQLVAAEHATARSAHEHACRHTITKEVALYPRARARSNQQAALGVTVHLVPAQLGLPPRRPLGGRGACGRRRCRRPIGHARWPLLRRGQLRRREARRPRRRRLDCSHVGLRRERRLERCLRGWLLERTDLIHRAVLSAACRLLRSHGITRLRGHPFVQQHSASASASASASSIACASTLLWGAGAGGVFVGRAASARHPARDHNPNVRARAHRVAIEQWCTPLDEDARACAAADVVVQQLCRGATKDVDTRSMAVEDTVRVQRGRRLSGHLQRRLAVGAERVAFDHCTRPRQHH